MKLFRSSLKLFRSSLKSNAGSIWISLRKSECPDDVGKTASSMFCPSAIITGDLLDPLLNENGSIISFLAKIIFFLARGSSKGDSKNSWGFHFWLIVCVLLASVYGNKIIFSSSDFESAGFLNYYPVITCYIISIWVVSLKWLGIRESNIYDVSSSFRYHLHYNTVNQIISLIFWSYPSVMIRMIALSLEFLLIVNTFCILCIIITIF